ncbi:Sodium channel modifier 1 [Bulinus truncatus]|nr:Sodium channel modifier 1 [Bulinus truncatus]
MSFKREGNDYALLYTLRKRRIKELLCEDIPEDEAKLLSNGRFACVICQQNPIFDTVSMLSIHRNGKKHLLSNEIYLKKKKELKQLVDNRKHEQYVKDGMTSIRMAEPHTNSILTSEPYDPRVKKSKSKTEPKHEVRSSKTQSEVNSDMPSGTKSSDLPGYSYWSEICRKQISCPVSHNYRLKNIFANKTDVGIRYEPYKSKYRCTIKTINASSCDVPKNHPVVNDCGSGDKNKMIDSPCLEETKQTKISHPDMSLMPSNDPAPVANTTCTDPCFSISPQPAESQTGNKQSTSQTERMRDVTAIKAQHQVSFVKKLQLLQGSGWKRDWDGKWIKDELAEFDSDEEPPDIPLLF